MYKYIRYLAHYWYLFHAFWIILSSPHLTIADLGSINPENPKGNSHNSTNSANSVNNKVNHGDDDEPKKPAPQATGRKEKSVLQVKLTRLAIQIGYGGQFFTCSVNFPF